MTRLPSAFQTLAESETIQSAAQSALDQATEKSRSQSRSPQSRRRWGRRIRLNLLKKMTEEELEVRQIAKSVPTLKELDEGAQGTADDTASSVPTIGDLLEAPPPRRRGSVTESATVGSVTSVGAIMASAPEYRTIDTLGLPAPYMEMDLSFGDSEDGNGGTVRVWNLSNEQIGQMETADVILVEAGYRDAPPLQRVMPARIDDINTETRRTDRVTEITLTDSGQEWMTRRAWYTAPPGVSARQVLRDLAEQIALPLDTLDVDNDVTFRQGVSFDGRMPVRKAMREIADAGDGRVFVVDGAIHIQGKSPGKIAIPIIVSEDGWWPRIGEARRLKSDTDDAQGDWEITTLLDTNFKPGRTFEIFVPELRGHLEVLSVQIVADRRRFYSVMKCAETERDVSDVNFTPDIAPGIDPETIGTGAILGGGSQFIPKIGQVTSFP